jgi:hypothetical protein
MIGFDLVKELENKGYARTFDIQYIEIFVNSKS